MSKQVMGRAYITVAAQRLASVPGTAKLNTGGVERTAQLSDAGGVYYTEKPVAAELECDILITQDTDILALNRTTDAVVLFQADSGQSYMVRNGFVVAPSTRRPVMARPQSRCPARRQRRSDGRTRIPQGHVERAAQAQGRCRAY
ncbi:phage tail tube protein [Cupriavidus basilensis]